MIDDASEQVGILPILWYNKHMKSKLSKPAIFAIIVALIFAFVALAAWLITRPTLELYAECGSYTVHTVNHGTWSSFRYQVRLDNKILTDELTYSEFNDYIDTHDLTCRFVGGG